MPNSTLKSLIELLQLVPQQSIVSVIIGPVVGMENGGLNGLHSLHTKLVYYICI